MTALQKCAFAALLSLIVLIFVGAIVRATGAGLGCPDWPRCWGRLIPPTSVDQVDFAALDLERFRAKAERFGRDGAAITEASLRQEFNVVHVWTEYINRLFSMPVGLLALATFFTSLSYARRRPSLVFWAFAAVVLVGVNAWLGMRVVYSGLKPGTITTHMALAILLLGVLTYVAWRGCERPWRIAIRPEHRPRLPRVLVLLLILTVIEGVMGSQVREKTDALALHYHHAPRSAWTDELEHSWVYAAHRSFSWIILAVTGAFYYLAGKGLPQGCGWLERGILGLVLAQMLLGLILAHVGILGVVQVLHIGLSSLLVCALFLWFLGSRPEMQCRQV